MVSRPPLLLESLGSEGLSGLSPLVLKLHQDGYSATGGDEVDGLWRPVARRLSLMAEKSLGIVTPRDLGALPCLRKTACRGRTDGVTEIGRANVKPNCVSAFGNRRESVRGMDRPTVLLRG